MMLRRYAAWILCICIGSGFCARQGLRASVQDPEPLSAFPVSVLAIRSFGGQVINFKVWIADTPSRDEQGLMYVKSIDDHAGMLFVFPATRRVTMWMKNTYVPLDMLFIDESGHIDYIAPRATPLSLDVIAAPRPVRAVLELKGGDCEVFGIHAGDQVFDSHLPAAVRSPTH